MRRAVRDGMAGVDVGSGGRGMKAEVRAEGERDEREGEEEEEEGEGEMADDEVNMFSVEGVGGGDGFIWRHDGHSSDERGLGRVVRKRARR